jgi:hypothetical protein
MQINNIIQSSVGADLSRTPPMYRPWVGVPHIRIFFETALSALRGFPAIQIEKLISIISFNIRFQKCSKKS